MKSGTPLVRIHDPNHPWNRQRFDGPLPGARFDHHPPPRHISRDRSVWYASASLVGAVSECFGRLGIVDRSCGKRVVHAVTTAPILVLDLLGTGARSVRLDQEIATTTVYDRTQAWARAFYSQYPCLQGLRWRGRQAGSVCYLLQNRAMMKNLQLVSDHDVGSFAIWPRIARAARLCSLTRIA